MECDIIYAEEKKGIRSNYGMVIKVMKAKDFYLPIASVLNVGCLLAALFFSAAVNAAEIYVSTNGSDETGEGSVAAPYRTIQYAFTKAQQNDEVRVAGGMYRESVTNSFGGALAKSINLSGSWLEDFSARDLLNYRSTIKPPDALVGKVPCLYINNSTNIITGFTLTGGSDGFRCPDAAVPDCKGSKTVNFKLAYMIITNNTDGVDFDGCRIGCVITSSIIADNTNYGVIYNADNYAHFFLQNCTIVRNKHGVYRKHQFLASLWVYNTIFADNKYAIYNEKSNHHKTTFQFSNFWGNEGTLVQLLGYKSGTDNFKSDFVAIHSSDPCFDEMFAPSKSSEMYLGGTNLSASANYPVTMDVYGQSFGEVYPIGAVSCVGEETLKADDIYVNANTGDDANDGLSPESAKKTIVAAIMNIAPSGTVHLADGIYKERINLNVVGMKLVGESRDHTILCDGDDAVPVNASGFYDDYIWGIGVFANDVSVWNLTVRNVFIGFFMESDRYCQGLHIENCDINNNVFGLYLKWGDQKSPIFVENSKIRNNERYGIMANCGLRLKNLLVADNGIDGIYNSGPGNYDHNYMAQTYGANLTVIGNGGCGYRNTISNPTFCGAFFYNCVFADNLESAMYIYNADKNKEVRCAFYNNGPDGQTHFSNLTPILYSPIYEDPKLNATEALRGVPAEDSPLVQAGTNSYSKIHGPVTNDINYVKRLEGKNDIGCYVSTATMRDQAGDGVRLVSVSGAPNGYGFPAPMYGTHLVEDGVFSADVSDTLETDPVDAVRSYSLGTGFRARYDGYRVTSEATGEVLAESDSDETININASGNLNVVFKWTRQCRLVANATDEGCLVKINDNEPGLVVTNWVDIGKSVTITYMYNDGYTLDHWVGDKYALDSWSEGMPEGVSINDNVFTYTADIPRSFEVVSRGVFYVSTFGDDETGDGTKLKPWRTISKAVHDSSVVAGDTIKIQGGIYEESITNKTSLGGKGNLEFSGSWNSSWERDLVNSRTVIVPPDPFKMKAPCIFVEGLGYFKYSGIDLTGGSSAIYSNNQLGENLSATSHDTFYQVVVSNNVKGIHYGNSKLGAVIISSLFVNNDTYAYRRYSNQGGNDYIYNCTFADNKGWAIQREHSYAPSMQVRNCIFERNGGAVYNTGESSRWATLYDSCLGTVTNRYFGSGKRTGTAFYNIAMRDSTRYEDNSVDENWRIRSTATHLKKGKNLVNNAIFQYSADLYGTPFGEEWDYGCIKSGYPANGDVYAVQYVSEEGSDENNGTTAQTARRTISCAVNHIEENGTIYVAKGTYKPFMLGVKGVRVVGAGRGATVVAATSKELPDTCARPLIDIFKPYTTVESMTLKGGYAGIVNSSHNIAPYTTIRDIDVSGCAAGIYYVVGDNTANAGINKYYIHAERVKITDNLNVGFYAGGCVRLASSLIARNGSYGIYSAGQDQSSASLVVNTTIMDNQKGVVGTSGWANSIRLYNCIVAGNTNVGLERVNKNFSGGIELYNCVVFNEKNYNRIYDSTRPAESAGCIFLKTEICEADPLLKSSGKIPMSSPAVGYGANHTLAIKPLTYFDGKVIDYTKRVDAGCFSPGGGFMLIVK